MTARGQNEQPNWRARLRAWLREVGTTTSTPQAEDEANAAIISHIAGSGDS
ncbi:hypothetical protein [Terrabacter sp. BE26]|uniref:hypothetical protein n=1 Tax=Terrabacter sp. BE26 TaxID=2898152 RepID=UPI0035BE8FDC